MYVAESILTDAGRFKTVCMQLTMAYGVEMSFGQLLLLHATYPLTIS